MNTQAGADGELVQRGDQQVIRFERRFRHPVAEVWDAITNPDRISQWWLPFDADITLDLVPGGTYEMRGRGDDAPTLSWKVLQVEAPHVFQHTHANPGAVVTWTLSELGDGCLLELTQTVPGGVDAVGSNFLVGLHTSLERLGALLDGHAVEWNWDAFAEHQRRYAANALATSPDAQP